jgi:hypothetical protein
MRVLILLFITLFPFFSGKPAKDAIVVLEDFSGRNTVGTQIVGEKGKAGFQYLNAGSYQLAILFPQQEGKWLKEKPKHRTLAKATFNEKNGTYYYQGREGFFSVKLKKFRKIDRNSFRAIFRESRDENENKIAIAQFIARKNGAQFSLQIKKLTAAQFKRATKKIENDISMISIQGIK